MLPRLRLALARHRAVHGALVLVLALVPAVVIWQQIAAARAARDAWGTTRQVLVATRAVAAGEPLSASDVDRRAWPAALVPDGALGELPADRTVAAASITAGEPIVRNRLGDAGRSPLAALVPPGARAVAIPRGDTPLPVVQGDHVDVLAAHDLAGPASVAARNGTVLHVDDRTAVVAVAEGDLPAVAAAVTAGAAVLALA